MSHSLYPDPFLLPFDDLVGEDDTLGTLSPSDIADDWGGDDFSVSCRSSAAGSNESSRARPIGYEGLRNIDSASDADTNTDEQIVAIGDTDTPFFWECLRVEDDRRDPIEEFEWEDVADRVDDGDIFSMMAFAGDGVEENPNTNELEDGGDAASNVEWQVLLSVNDIGRIDAESVVFEHQEGLDFESEYEVLFSQFGDHGNAEWMKCCRPASKSVVESLPSVFLAEEDVTENNAHCAVCKDEISLTEKVKRLPCLHHYHENCILPWLVMRNTCPLCRYELPSTDASNAAILGAEEEDVQGWYDFEFLQVA